MAYEKVPNQTGQNWPVSTQYQTHPGAAVGVPASPQYNTFPEGGVTTLDILGSGSVLLWTRSDLGRDDDGATQFWRDQGVLDHDLSVPIASSPTFSASGGPGGFSTWQFNGTSNYFTNGVINLPDPATTSTWLRMIFRFRSWTIGDRICSSGTAARITLFQDATSGGHKATHGTPSAQNNGATVNSWVRLEALFSASASDYLKIASTSVGGASFGSGDPAAGIFLGCNQALALFGHIDVTEFVIANRNPSASEKSALDAADIVRYGGTVGM